MDKQVAYKWFCDNNIKTRNQLREILSSDDHPYQHINKTLIEGYFSDYKSEVIKGIEKPLTTKKIITINDTHVPFQNNKMIANFVTLLEDEQPDELVLNGDMVDFYDLSSFDKDPSREDTIQDELDTLYRLLLVFRGACPNAKITYVEGNHEDRLRRYLWKKAPALHSLRGLQLEKLLKLDKLDIECVKKYVVNGFTFAHGEIVRQYASYSAKAEYDKRGCSGISGHCFAENVELLTKRGWIKGFELLPEDIVGTMNKQSGLFEWNKINEFHQYDNYTELYNIKNMCADISVTDKHGLILQTRDGKRIETTPKELYDNNRELNYILATKNYVKDYDISDDMLRLIINIVADGSFSDINIRYHLKKERKITHLKELLDRLQIRYTCNTSKVGTFKINIGANDTYKILEQYFQDGIKHLPEFIKNLSTRQARIVLDEYSITDGCKNSSATNSYQLCSSKEKEIDILQELFAKNGYRSSKLDREGCFTLTVNERELIRNNKETITKVPYSGKVWCVSVDNGTLLVRSNGKTMVTLNTHRMGSYCKTTSLGTFGWWENGCGCELTPEYIDEPNWQNGFSVIYFDDNAFDVHQVYVHKGRFRFNGKLY